MMAKSKNYYQVEERNVKSFAAVFKLFNRYYIKSFFGPFFSFVFPVLIYAILGSVMGYKTMLPGLISMSTMSVGLSGLPFSIMELKKSVLLKRIGASPVKPWVFTVTIVSYFFVIIFITILWMMLWGLIFTHNTKIFDSMGTVTGFFGFWYGVLISIVLSVSFGFMIASVSKNEMQAQAYGMLIMFPSNFLSGQFLSPDVIASNHVLEWVSRFIPFRYTTMIISESWYGNSFVEFAGGIAAKTGLNFEMNSGNPFLIHEFQSFSLPQMKVNDVIANKGGMLQGTMTDFIKNNAKATVLWDDADHICGYAIPYSFIALNLGISAKKFRWSAAR